MEAWNMKNVWIWGIIEFHTWHGINAENELLNYINLLDWKFEFGIVFVIESSEFEFQIMLVIRICEHRMLVMYLVEIFWNWKIKTQNIMLNTYI